MLLKKVYAENILYKNATFHVISFSKTWSLHFLVPISVTRTAWMHGKGCVWFFMKDVSVFFDFSSYEIINILKIYKCVSLCSGDISDICVTLQTLYTLYANNCTVHLNWIACDKMFVKICDLINLGILKWTSFWIKYLSKNDFKCLNSKLLVL